MYRSLSIQTIRAEQPKVYAKQNQIKSSSSTEVVKSSIQLKTPHSRQSEYPNSLSSRAKMSPSLSDQFSLENFSRKNGWQLDGMDDEISTNDISLSIYCRWVSKNSKSSVVTSPPSLIPSQKSIACAFLRLMKSSPRVVSGIS